MLKEINSFFQNKKIQILATLLAIVVYYIYTFGNYDLKVSDEDVYLAAGINLKLPMDHFLNLLYPLGIKLLRSLISDPLNLVYTYYFILSSATFIFFIVFLKNHTQRFWVPYFVSLCFLFSTFQISLLPRITILNLVIGLFFLSKISINKTKYQNWGNLTVSLLLCNFVSRPEFFWFFILSFCIFTYFIFKENTHFFNKKALIWLGLVCLVFLLYYLGGGINEPGKLKVAFTQHFFDNYQVWYGKKFDYDEEFLVFEKIYGKVNSDFDLIKANPSMFFHHVFTNFLNYFNVISKILKSSFYEIFIKFFEQKTKFFFIFICLTFVPSIKWKESIVNFINEINNFLHISVYLIFFLLPTVVSVLVVYPRDHYAILHLPLYLLIISFIFKSLVYKNIILKNVFQYGLTLLILIGVSTHFPFPKEPVSNTRFYKYMKLKSKENKLHFLSNDIFGFNYYSGNMKISVWNPKKQDLVTLINSGQFDGVILYYLDLEVEENRQFVKSGFKKTNLVRIPTFEKINRYIWVKPELASKFSTQ